MLKRLLAGVAVLLIGLTAFAGELDIPSDKRVKNLPSGCCAWCSIENLGRVHGVVALDGLTKRRHERHETLVQVQTTEWMAPHGWVQVTRTAKLGDAPATPATVREELASLKVKFKVQDESSKDTKILTESINANLGCAVGVRNWPKAGDYHMVTLTDLTDKKCVFVDNLGECDRYTGSREWFDAHWSGFTVVVYPDAEKAPAPRENK